MKAITFRAPSRLWFHNIRLLRQAPRGLLKEELTASPFDLVWYASRRNGAAASDGGPSDAELPNVAS